MLPAAGMVVLVEEVMEAGEDEAEGAISLDSHMTPCIYQDRWVVEVVILPVEMEAGVEVTVIKIYEGCSKRIAYFYLDTSNFKLAQNCSLNAIKELPVARNAKLQPMYPLLEAVKVS